ncbi:acyl-CoA dehydrogenase family protein [Streptomyces griseoaurantiacus]|uniref:acyl-CoA dehydrogenase family protein n=1 Tax=Streptomyces griseoaurantiacus TaxID=68213 RepID=UPI00379FAE89
MGQSTCVTLARPSRGPWVRLIAQSSKDRLGWQGSGAGRRPPGFTAARRSPPARGAIRNRNEALPSRRTRWATETTPRADVAPALAPPGASALHKGRTARPWLPLNAQVRNEAEQVESRQETAEALVAKARANATDQQGRLAPENLEALREAGLLALGAPAEFGGADVGLVTSIRVLSERGALEPVGTRAEW